MNPPKASHKRRDGSVFCRHKSSGLTEGDRQERRAERAANRAAEQRLLLDPEYDYQPFTGSY